MSLLKLIRTGACLLTLSLGVSVNAGGTHTTLYGRIVAVSDGDTLTLLDVANTQHKIRLAGIDAPERAQPFGNRSKQSLSDLAFNRQATVETMKKDRYGRSVGKVLVDGQDVNLQQVARGMAWFYRQYQREQSLQDRLIYGEAEGHAKQARIGIWSDVAPVPPWEHRRMKRTKSGETDVP